MKMCLHSSLKGIFSPLSISPKDVRLFFVAERLRQDLVSGLFSLLQNQTLVFKVAPVSEQKMVQQRSLKNAVEPY